MAFDSMKADMAVIPFEHSATARCRRNHDRRLHLGFHAGIIQRCYDKFAFSVAVGVRRQILQRTAATDTKMTAK